MTHLEHLRFMKRINRGGPFRFDLFDLFVALHFAVADVDDAVGVHGDVVLVGHQHDRVALLVAGARTAP